MNRKELVASVAEKQGFYKSEVETMVDTIFETIMDNVAQGEDVRITNFGSFRPVKRKAKMARNPQTGEAVYVEEKLVPVFKPAIIFKEKVAGVDED